MGVCLVTGVGGFLGSHLADFLLAQGWNVAGIRHPRTRSIIPTHHRVTLVECDMLNKAQVEATVQVAQPDVIFHLAAQSLPIRSWREPEATFQVNVLGTLNLLEAARKAGPDPVLVVAGSSAEYAQTPNEIPVCEDAPLMPESPYGVSKVAASLLTLLHHRAFGTKVIVVRPFFVIGPRKVGDVCSDFARGIIAVEKGERPSLKVGNLQAVRDLLDVEDAVRAFTLLMREGRHGDVYNLCSGVGYTIQTVLDKLLAMTTGPIPVEHDPIRLHVVDKPVVIGNNSRLRALGWAPRVDLDQSLARILDFWHRRA